jgi:hypothetical protein
VDEAGRDGVRFEVNPDDRNLPRGLHSGANSVRTAHNEHIDVSSDGVPQVFFEFGPRPRVAPLDHNTSVYPPEIPQGTAYDLLPRRCCAVEHDTRYSLRPHMPRHAKQGRRQC